jgi:hypothetical protein
MVENIPPSFPSNHKTNIHVFMPSHNSHSLFHTAPKRLNGLKRKDLDLTLKCRFLNLTWLWNDFAEHREREWGGEKGRNRESGNSPVKEDKDIRHLPCQYSKWVGLGL